LIGHPKSHPKYLRRRVVAMQSQKEKTPPPPPVRKCETKLLEDGTLDCIADDPGNVIKVKIIQEGDGRFLEIGWRATVDYEGKLMANGKMFLTAFFCW
jgi:FKBP-type peptidyl-prolyl cis-trans isomerase